LEILHGVDAAVDQCDAHALAIQAENVGGQISASGSPAVVRVAGVETLIGGEYVPVRGDELNVRVIGKILELAGWKRVVSAPNHGETVLQLATAGQYFAVMRRGGRLAVFDDDVDSGRRVEVLELLVEVRRRNLSETGCAQSQKSDGSVTHFSIPGRNKAAGLPTRWKIVRYRNLRVFSGPSDGAAKPRKTEWLNPMDKMS
jgi:DNA-binding transcriptional LysR family regulator